MGGDHKGMGSNPMFAICPTPLNRVLHPDTYPAVYTRPAPRPGFSPGALPPGPRRSDYVAGLPPAQPTFSASAFCFMRSVAVALPAPFAALAIICSFVPEQQAPEELDLL